jgi:hypothetical protein
LSEQFSGRVTILDGQSREVFAFDSQFAVLDLGAQGNDGDLRLHSGDGQTKISLDAGLQRLVITNAAGVTVFRFNASDAVLDLGPSLGGTGAAADLRLFGVDGQVKIHLDGSSGDIRLIGADCAEEFDVEESSEAGPGSVMTMGLEGRLRSCAQAYDRRVAGVVSGAGGLQPGIVLDSRRAPGRATVALTGKVYCRIDAGYGPIEVGDPLTTSETVGHAMKVTDRARAFGATLGKAMRPLPAGTGLVPILVALQ